MHEDVGVSVATWNCLADCYANGVSQAKSKEANKILSWAFRSEKICNVIEKEDADIVCLQEVDHFERTFKPFLSSLGYQTVYLIRPGRQDGVLIAFKRTKFQLIEQDFVKFDNLVDVKGTSLSLSQRTRLKKQNVAIILLLQMRATPYGDAIGRKPVSFTVCTAHLYWNPSSPLVKLAQTAYLLERIARVRNESGLLPAASILTGDFNSLPQSQAYERILSGIPCHVPLREPLQHAVERACDVFSTKSQSGNAVRFICDATLGRLARWLRLLGVDTALENTRSQDKRSIHNDYSELFDKARSEHRIIVTTSTGMMKRAACPETFLIKGARTDGLESSLAKLLNFYNVKLEKSDFLSICCKCGGRIETCEQGDKRLEGKEAPADRNLFVCEKCHQVYWRSSSVTGSCVRALKLAEKLFSMVQEDRKRRFSDITNDANGSVTETQTSCCKQATIVGGRDSLCWEASLQSQQCRASHQSWLRYASAFVLANGREPDYTNINGTFRGTLDYIFLGGACRVNSVTIREGIAEATTKKSYPNGGWPSDHVFLHAHITLRNAQFGRVSFPRCLSLSETRNIR